MAKKPPISASSFNVKKLHSGQGPSYWRTANFLDLVNFCRL
jgi:hypothetical protein